MDGDCQASCQDGRDAVLLRNNACLGIQGLQQVRQASADAVSLRQGVTLAIGRSSLGVAHGVDAVFSRHIRFVLHRRSCSHIDLAIRDGRVHKAQLAAQRPQAHADGEQGKPWNSKTTLDSCLFRLVGELPWPQMLRLRHATAVTSHSRTLEALSGTLEKSSCVSSVSIGQSEHSLVATESQQILKNQTTVAD